MKILVLVLALVVATSQMKVVLSFLQVENQYLNN